jgi:hypothetical protein
MEIAWSHESGTDSPHPKTRDAYEAMLKPELLPGLSKKKGYRGRYLSHYDPTSAHYEVSSNQLPGDPAG